MSSPKVSYSEEYKWVFPTFIDGSSENLFLAESSRGKFDWENLRMVYDTPFGLRDPSIIQVGDTFYCAATMDAWVEPVDSIPIMKSTDLENWTITHYIDMNEKINFVSDTSVIRTWGPEWFEDYNGDIYLIISIGLSYPGSYWTIHGWENQQTYCLKSLNNTMTEWGDLQKLQIDTLALVNDCYLLKKDNKYYLFYVNEVNPYPDNYHYTQRAESDSFPGFFTTTKEGNWHGWGRSEGISIHKIKDKYRAYFDISNIADGATRVGYSESYDLDSWTPKVDLNINIYHGTPFRLNIKTNKIIKSNY